MTRHSAAAVLVLFLAVAVVANALLFVAYADDPFQFPGNVTAWVAAIAGVEVAAHLVVAAALAARWRWAAIGAWVLSGAMVMGVVPLAGTALATWSLTPFGFFTSDAALIATATLYSVAIAGYVALVLLAARVERELA